MAAGNTFTQITSQTLTSDTGTINLSSFSGYTDLRIVITYICSGSNSPRATFNNSTSGYEQYTFYSFGSSSPSVEALKIEYYNTSFAYLYGGRSQVGTTIPARIVIDLPYYTDTNAYHYMFTSYGSNLAGSDSLSYAVDTVQTSWRDSSAISTIQITAGAGNTFATGTVVSVYGILEA